MDYKNTINHNCNIKCPKCNHTYSYDFKFEDSKKSTNKKRSVENSYEFLTYLICKNPLCNYDIEIKGEFIVNSSNAPDLIKITSIK
ncbi:hypothetical protein [Terrisporobacter mayombei]|uniref:Zinc finger Ogr/Delta-type domain-containing protein n=1 Tax=Terrisporobacter mayombei TaxID=1541 RepID=A0ABY9Q539_9FIRM|nr:hypothetical protein [Terrisporobacter mayombei]MCC3868764.1 hypothetical protein [Terrisporobacter mayombei]WMT83108.1 hypothetical protein TEMA_36060 [Terrisporobacter mayombei]